MPKFYKTMDDIDPMEMNEELEKFVIISKENKDLKPANDFLSYIYPGMVRGGAGGYKVPGPLMF